MDSSAEANTPAINPAVGGLVWVRRRNGSWWPGRIMGLDELSGDSLLSPRSGTPVKLLGREDASVDWYNLERSKRVKAFRCGDYDKCIEKAKAAATGSRRAVKYVRREDAILHALELETSVHSNDMSKYSSRMVKTVGDEDDSSYAASPIMSNSAELYVVSQDTSTSTHEPSQSVISYEESAHELRPKTPNDSEDDELEGMKRMRGLEDLGLNAVKVQTNFLNEHEQDTRIVVHDKDTIPVRKRKRSQVVHDQQLSKKKCRHRTITHVLESTCSTLVPVPLMWVRMENFGTSFLRGVLNKEYSVLECHESKKLIKNVISNTSGLPVIEFTDGLLEVPFVEEDQTYAADFASILASPSQKVIADALWRNEELCDQALTTPLSAYGGIMNEEMERSASKWQSKRKRNTRHTKKIVKHDLGSPKNPDDVANGELTGFKHIAGTRIESDLHVMSKADIDDTSNVALHVTRRLPGTEPDPTQPDGDDTLNDTLHVSQHLTCTKPDNMDDTSNGIPNTEPDIKKQEMDNTSSRDLHLRQHFSTTVSDSKNMLDLSRPNQMPIPYRQSQSSLGTEYQTENLYDVVLGAKTDFQPQHVPLVSLMSNSNRKAIIGHPLTVEAMKEGSSNQLIKGGFSSSRKRKSGNGVKFKKDRRSSSKRKKSSMSLKKTRKLSALTKCRMITEAKSLPIVEKINKQTVIACIPLQVVFSRLNEAVK